MSDDDRVSVSDIGWNRQLTTVAEGVHHASAFSTVTAFETEEGLVLVDAGLREAAPWMAERLRERTDLPIHTVIYTHGHVDHVHGTGAFVLDGQEKPRVVAHENMPARFDRYEYTQGHNDAINARQFGGTVEAELSDGTSNFRRPEYPPRHPLRGGSHRFGGRPHVRPPSREGRNRRPHLGLLPGA